MSSFLLNFLLNRKFKRINIDLNTTFAIVEHIEKIFADLDPIKSIDPHKAAICGALIARITKIIHKLLKKYKYNFEVTIDDYENYSHLRFMNFLESANQHLFIRRILRELVQHHQMFGYITDDGKFRAKVQLVYDCVTCIKYEIQNLNEQAPQTK